MKKLFVSILSVTAFFFTLLQASYSQAWRLLGVHVNYDVQFFDDKNGILNRWNSVIGNSEIYKTHDGGSSWINTKRYCYWDFKFIDSLHGYTYSKDDYKINNRQFSVLTLNRTTDGAATWETILSDTSFDDIYNNPEDLQKIGSNLYLLTWDRLYISTDNGKNWRIKTKEFNGVAAFLSMYFIDDKNAVFSQYAEGPGVVGAIFTKTTDGGESWAESYLLNDVYEGRSKMVSEKVGYYHSSGLYRTTDGCKSWQPILPPKAYKDLSFRGFLFLDELRFYTVLGEDILYTKDGGRTFVKEDANIPMVNQGNIGVKMILSPTGNKIWAITAQHHIYTKDLGINTVAKETSSKMLKLIPNPTLGKFNVKFNLTKPEKVNVFIQDLSGNTVMVLAQDRLFKEGNNSVECNQNELPSGTYFCVIQTAGSEKNSIKLEIQK